MTTTQGTPQMVEVQTKSGVTFRGTLIDLHGGVRLTHEGHGDVIFVPNFRIENLDVS